MFACCCHIQTTSCSVTCAGLATCTARMQTRFPSFFFNSRYSAPAFTTPLLFEENTAYILHTHAVVCESLRRPSLQHREEASSSGDGDQVSCRRLERSVFMAAAGRDVSLAPSIQLPSDGFSPCFIIIPIISRGGGPRLPPSSSLSPPARSVPRTRHSSRHMQYELKTCLL